MSAPERRERIRGCLLGGAIGDALGAPVEFLSTKAIRAAFGPRGIVDFAPAYGRLGAITDDTQMTLFTAEGLLRAVVRWSSKGIVSLPSMLERAYLRWLLTQDLAAPDQHIEASGWLLQQRELHARRAPGRTCVTSLQQPATSLRAANHSKGCGGVMRVAPFGLSVVGIHAEARAFEQGCMAAAITHGHASGQLAAGAFAAIVALLVQGRGLDAAVERALELLSAHPSHHEVSAALQEACALTQATEVSADEAIARLGQGWVAEEALAIALYCAVVSRDFESAVILAVNHDGDSDSTGSIAGQMLGAMCGVDTIPERWLAALELADVIRQVADDLHAMDGFDLDRDRDSEDVRAFLARYPGN